MRTVILLSSLVRTRSTAPLLQRSRQGLRNMALPNRALSRHQTKSIPTSQSPSTPPTFGRIPKSQLRPQLHKHHDTATRYRRRLQSRRGIASAFRAHPHLAALAHPKGIHRTSTIKRASSSQDVPIQVFSSEEKMRDSNCQSLCLTGSIRSKVDVCIFPDLQERAKAHSSEVYVLASYLPTKLQCRL